MDRFASFANKQILRYNARWRDGATEAVDSLYLRDAEWRREENWCSPPWELLDDLVVKQRTSEAAATAIAPYWPKKPWFLHLAEMSSETVDMPPESDLFIHKSSWDEGG